MCVGNWLERKNKQLHICAAGDAAFVSVPRKAARGPGKCGQEWGDGVDQRVADEDVVVEGDEEGEEQGADAEAAEGGHHLPDLQGAHLGVLGQRDLQVEERQADYEEHGQKGDDKGAAAVFEAQVGEAPHVAEADGEADAGHQELARVFPLLPVHRPVIISI